WHGGCRYFRTRAAHIPPSGCSANRRGLDRARNRPTPPHGVAPDRGEDQSPVVQVRAVAILLAILLVGERTVAVAALVAGRAGLLLPGRHPPEDGVIGTVQPGEHIL